MGTGRLKGPLVLLEGMHGVISMPINVLRNQSASWPDSADKSLACAITDNSAGVVAGLTRVQKLLNGPPKTVANDVELRVPPPFVSPIN